MNSSKKLLALFGTLLSGICWYLSFDLSLHAWWALWLAPIPVLYLSMRVTGFQAYGVAFLAVLIGRLSWFSFLHTVLPLPVVLLFTIIFPAIFGMIILAVRKIIASSPPVIAIFAYPVLWTAFEYLQFLYSRDGTNGSIAYTQCDLLPLVQLASLTGVLGITFVVSFVPSVVALALYSHRGGKKSRNFILPALFLVLCVFIFGLIRLYSGRTQKGGTAGRAGESMHEVTVGLAAISINSYHKSVYDRRPETALYITNLYLQEVRALSDKGAQIILLPEKGIAVSDSTEAVIRGLFQDAARHFGVTIIVGVNSLSNDRLECQAWVISPDGRLLLNYRKVKLFEGEVADGFMPGKGPGFFPLKEALAGVAICKDLDFEKYMRLYRQQGASILYVPAWDFNRDGWFHSRIAMMRAVENGYSLVRNAQEGRLTISDDRGRVLAEANAEDGQRGFLTGRVGPSAGPTLYSRWGDWFGLLNLFAAVGFLLFLVMRVFRVC
ncbi:MAG TPA: nitrilase-related carbon-nitrogen hydrolase [Puia sp.]|nr:nitrilase-related carbon-nitrogen hydrolase [Puia sp.]